MQQLQPTFRPTRICSNPNSNSTALYETCKAGQRNLDVYVVLFDVWVIKIHQNKFQLSQHPLIKKEHDHFKFQV